MATPVLGTAKRDIFLTLGDFLTYCSVFRIGNERKFPQWYTNSKNKLARVMHALLVIHTL